MAVARRLYLLVFTAALGLPCLAGSALYQMNRIHEGVNQANLEIIPGMIVLDEAAHALTDTRVRLDRYLPNTDPARASKLGLEPA
jgi:hypothetical protein